MTDALFNGSSAANFYTDELPISELVADADRVLGTDASRATLHYCSPAHGGWGVVKVALTVPETFLLFVCPAACGRHGAIASIEQGYRKKIGYLCITDNEIVLGGYEEEIERAVRELMERVKPRPRALIIFVSCIDDLLGTDYTTALARMEAEHHIPVKLARMNPISMDSKLPPGIRVQKSMYELLPSPVEKDRSILLMGAYRPPTQTSELAKLLKHYGFGPIRHPEYCTDFDSFTEFSRSAASLVVRPEGRAAAEDLRERLGIPEFRAFMAFDRETIFERYRGIIAFLESLNHPGETKDYSPSRESMEAWFKPFIEALEAREAEARTALAGASIALDTSVTIAPFSLALALVKSGLNVTRIYTSQLPGFEKPHLEELARIKGDIMVASPNHVRKYGLRSTTARADIALGFEAGYATSAPITVPVAFDEQLYGFEGYTMVLEAILKSVAVGKSDLRQQVKDYGLVV
ncbi:conserved hypothetical protein [Treponema primitia ZAS-2]|uniref:Nitrogenase/oxidoreductase component 1 domain-containing protein n=1 Tax=Treponema primitia (strain ATCC BAA-887 / DSM 12427 / ZAS-2) TaxID=545694 RepID=F5YIT5_TREPZ|nr:nitrogenase component 1 [Treponema primitia]AEF85470.1 conserved hypothetical protein [Treponema primitia ZAS-2]